jgi:hypothetical protein
MKTYEVTIRATITKDVLVEAEDENKAAEQAHEEFSVLNDGSDENYKQETLNVEERKS